MGTAVDGGAVAGAELRRDLGLQPVGVPAVLADLLGQGIGGPEAAVAQIERAGGVEVGGSARSASSLLGSDSADGMGFAAPCLTVLTRRAGLGLTGIRAP